jgi:hypothetical protein
MVIAALASCSCMAPIILAAIIIVAAASPMRANFEVVFCWILPDGRGIFTTKPRRYS